MARIGLYPCLWPCSPQCERLRPRPQRWSGRDRKRRIGVTTGGISTLELAVAGQKQPTRSDSPFNQLLGTEGTRNSPGGHHPWQVESGQGAVAGGQCAANASLALAKRTSTCAPHPAPCAYYCKPELASTMLDAAGLGG